MAPQAPVMMAPPSAPTAPWNNPKYQFKSFFSYELDIPTALTAASSQTQSFNIAGDSDFFWTKFTSFALVNGQATVRGQDALPAVTILITNTTTGRQYSNNPTPLPSVSGTGPLPFILPQITLWEAKSTVSVILANIGDQDYSNLMLTFEGIKAFL